MARRLTTRDTALSVRTLMAVPKSATFRMPPASSKFSGFKSLCRMPCVHATQSGLVLFGMINQVPVRSSALALNILQALQLTAKHSRYPCKIWQRSRQRMH